MTPSRPPTWREFERFLAIDGWVELRRTGHVFYEKVLIGGEILQTHRSLAGDKSMSMGRFRQILAVQLRVSVSDFWGALAAGHPVPRPSPEPEPAPAALPAWLATALERELVYRPGVGSSCLLIRTSDGGDEEAGRLRPYTYPRVRKRMAR